MSRLAVSMRPMEAWHRVKSCIKTAKVLLSQRRQINPKWKMAQGAAKMARNNWSQAIMRSKEIQMRQQWSTMKVWISLSCSSNSWSHYKPSNSKSWDSQAIPNRRLTDTVAQLNHLHRQSKGKVRKRWTRHSWKWLSNSTPWIWTEH